MVKLLGILLVISSLLSLIGGVIIDEKFSRSPHLTGNVVSSVITQYPAPMEYPDYAEAVTFSYSIVSFIMGVVFLFRI